MEKVFIYWDNSNIIHEAHRLAEERERGPNARFRVRVHFENIYLLAHAGREVECAHVAGAVPWPVQNFWTRMENEGTEVQICEPRTRYGGTVNAKQALQVSMLRDIADYNGDPGIAVLLTGDGAGFADGIGFHADLERMLKKGWRIEVISWEHSCKLQLKEWARKNGKFIALDDFYESVTYLEPSREGEKLAPARDAAELDLSRRPV